MSLTKTQSELFHLAGCMPIPSGYPDEGLISLEEKCVFTDSKQDSPDSPLIKVENRISPTIMIRTYVRPEDVCGLRLCQPRDAYDKDSTTASAHRWKKEDCEFVFGREILSCCRGYE